MKKTGTILKEAREKKGISIYEVSTATKINPKNIMAMEEGAIERLPPKTFLRGFVASYATYLQIDTTEILKVFFEEMGSTRPELAIRDQSTGDLQKTEDVRDNSGTDKSAVAALTDNKKIGYFKIYGIVAIIILIIVIGLIKRKMDSYESESITQTNSVPQIAMSENSINSSQISGATSAPNPAGTPTPAPVSTPTPAPVSTPIPKPSPTLTPAPNINAIKNVVDDKLKANISSTPSPAISPSPAPGRTQEVVIEALNDVEVIIQIDNEPSKKITLHHDEVQSIKARRKVNMKFSDGGAVNLTVNGKDRGVPGDLGKPKKVDVP